MKTVRIALLLALALMLLAAMPVSAGKPEIIEGVYYDNSPWADAPCSFEVMDEELLDVHTVLYYDSQGNLLRENTLLTGTNAFYTEDNPSVRLVAKTRVTIHYDYATMTGYVTGALGNLTLPGYGTVQMLAGRWDWNLYQTDFIGSHLAGKDSLKSPKDIEQFCSYLAGN